MTPGKLRRRVAVQQPQFIDDGYGNSLAGWDTRFMRWCNVRYLRGSETVMAARLQARQPVLVTIRRDSETATITPEWRLVIDGRSYNIREHLRPTDNLGHFEFLCEGGVAV